MNFAHCVGHSRLRSMFTQSLFEYVPINGSSSRTGLIPTEGNSTHTHTAGYAWYFTCDLQPSRSGKYS